MRIADGIPQIVYFRAGRESCPLAVFLPGGGHLARVAYGHEGAERRDFLDPWLADEGFGLLALSYPSDYAAFADHHPDLSISKWASSSAELIREHVGESPLRPIVILGWSSAGRSVVAIARALRARGMTRICFISLAATAPLPNLYPSPATTERFTKEGFWDSSTRHRQWWAQVKQQHGEEGRSAIDEKTYLSEYVVNSPFGLRGEPIPDVTASPGLVDEIGAFAYEEYPPMAALIPDAAEDLSHALTDRAMWGALNVLRIARRIGADVPQPDANWEALRDLVAQVPERLSRTVRGGHFFFLGSAGARTTARHIAELSSEMGSLEDELGAVARHRDGG